MAVFLILKAPDVAITQLVVELLALIILIYGLSGCAYEEVDTSRCNPENPLEMEWMAVWIGELQHCICIISIFQAEYSGEPVFWQLTNDPLCQSIIDKVSVFNCLGEEILVLKNYQDWIDFNEQVTCQKIIYSCPKI